MKRYVVIISTALVLAACGGEEAPLPDTSGVQVTKEQEETFLTRLGQISPELAEQAEDEDKALSYGKAACAEAARGDDTSTVSINLSKRFLDEENGVAGDSIMQAVDVLCPGIQGNGG